MASPQVTGVLACLLEVYPRMTPAQAKEWIVNTAKTGKITESSGFYDLLGAPNKFLYYDQQRKQEGQLTPFDRNGLRKTSGQVYPRPKIFRYG
jgi:subtilisin family serine protease